MLGSRSMKVKLMYFSKYRESNCMHLWKREKKLSNKKFRNYTMESRKINKSLSVYTQLEQNKKQ